MDKENSILLTENLLKKNDNNIPKLLLTLREYKKVRSKIIINRKITKIPVMTIPYNVGLKTMSKELLLKLDGRLVQSEDLFNTPVKDYEKF